MNLFLNVDTDYKTGWEGYDYVVNREVLSASQSALAKNAGGWKWNSAGKVEYRAARDEMELAIPRSLLPRLSSPPQFDFKWADNYQGEGDIRDFTLNGDTAPNDRFNYQFQAARPELSRQSQ